MMGKRNETAGIRCPCPFSFIEFVNSNSNSPRNRLNCDEAESKESSPVNSSRRLNSNEVSKSRGDSDLEDFLPTYTNLFERVKRTSKNDDLFKSSPGNLYMGNCASINSIWNKPRPVPKNRSFEKVSYDKSVPFASNNGISSSCCTSLNTVQFSKVATTVQNTVDSSKVATAGQNFAHASEIATTEDNADYSGAAPRVKLTSTDKDGNKKRLSRTGKTKSPSPAACQDNGSESDADLTLERDSELHPNENRRILRKDMVFEKTGRVPKDCDDGETTESHSSYHDEKDPSSHVKKNRNANTSCSKNSSSDIHYVKKYIDELGTKSKLFNKLDILEKKIVQLNSSSGSERSCRAPLSNDADILYLSDENTLEKGKMMKTSKRRTKVLSRQFNEDKPTHSCEIPTSVTEFECSSGNPQQREPGDSSKGVAYISHSNSDESYFADQTKDIYKLVSEANQCTNVESNENTGHSDQLTPSSSAMQLIKSGKQMLSSHHQKPKGILTEEASVSLDPNLKSSSVFPQELVQTTSLSCTNKYSEKWAPSMSKRDGLDNYRTISPDVCPMNISSYDIHSHFALEVDGQFDVENSAKYLNDSVNSSVLGPEQSYVDEMMTSPIDCDDSDDDQVSPSKKVCKETDNESSFSETSYNNTKCADNVSAGKFTAEPGKNSCQQPLKALHNEVNTGNKITTPDDSSEKSIVSVPKQASCENQHTFRARGRPKKNSCLKQLSTVDNKINDDDMYKITSFKDQSITKGRGRPKKKDEDQKAAVTTCTVTTLEEFISEVVPKKARLEINVKNDLSSSRPKRQALKVSRYDSEIELKTREAVKLAQTSSVHVDPLTEGGLLNRNTMQPDVSAKLKRARRDRKLVEFQPKGANGQELAKQQGSRSLPSCHGEDKLHSEELTAFEMKLKVVQDQERLKKIEQEKLALQLELKRMTVEVRKIKRLEEEVRKAKQREAEALKIAKIANMKLFQEKKEQVKIQQDFQEQAKRDAEIANLAHQMKANAAGGYRRPQWECPVCLEPRAPTTQLSITPCGHMFCKYCILRVAESTHKCPICTRKFRINQITPIFINIAF